MTLVLEALRALAAADVGEWCGFPADLGVAYAGAVIPLDGAPTGEGFLGEERRPASRLRAESPTYAGGLRVWHEDGRVLLLERRDPLDETGQRVAAPGLRPAGATLDLAPGKESVYGTRVLGLRVDAESLLTSVIGFALAPVDFDRARPRPGPPPQRRAGEAR